jgi:serine/threonine-protein kinase
MHCHVCGYQNRAQVIACEACGAQLNMSVLNKNMGILPSGTKLLNGVYEIKRVLGQGGFGITYQAHDTRLSRPVALKEFFPEGCWREGTTVISAGRWTSATYTDAKDNFLQEGKALGQFNHPGIVRVFYYFEENNTAYMVMEYLHGKSLAKLLQQRGGKMSEKESFFYIGKIAQALKIIHEGQFLHQDIKPDNVMLTDDDRVVLVDFGAARDFAGKNKDTKFFTAMLTPGYAPLEQYGQTLKMGAFTDVYALGATLYHLLTGEIPTSAVERAAGVELKSIRELNPNINPEIEQAIFKAMMMEAQQRSQSVEDFLSLLNKGKASAIASDEKLHFYQSEQDPWTAFSPSKSHPNSSRSTANGSNQWF